MALYEDFFPYILNEVPGAAEIVVTNAVRSAAIEFCEKSLVLTRDHDPVTIKAGVVDYDLEPPKDSLVIKIQKVWLDGNQLEAAAPDLIRESAIYNRSYDSYQSGAAVPRVYLQKDERTVSVWPLADKDYVNGLTMRVALKPTRASTSVDDVLLEEYAEVIASGALARLMISPGKPYTNDKAAGVHRALFERGINLARSRTAHGHVRSNLSVQLRKI